MSEVKEMDWYMLACVAIIGGLICIYAAYLLNAVFAVNYFAFIGAGCAILATVWGADAVRKICKYGIGTGVPSIGMMAFGMGLLATLLGLRIGDYLVAKNNVTLTLNNHTVNLLLLVGPIVALVLALVLGAIVGWIANSVLKMKIPTMQMGMIFIAGAASLIYIGWFTVITGTFGFSVVVNNIIDTGYIAPIFMIGALPMLHPFNACLGPDENQKRTLTLAVEASLLTMIIFGIVSLGIFGVSPVNDYTSSAITVVLGLLLWLLAYLAYWKEVKACGVIIKGTGLLPKKEEGQ